MIPSRTFAQKLRTNMTDAERLLWDQLKQKQIHGAKFRRQYPIGRYVVDFICLEKDLIIEIDGGQHSESKEADLQRDQWLKKKGFKVLRFWNHEIFKNLEGVKQVIEKNVLEPHPNPPLSGIKRREEATL